MSVYASHTAVINPEKTSKIYNDCCYAINISMSNKWK